jgi:peptide-methionine (S)-S-oxide reductase
MSKKTAIFAAGCFWSVELMFQRLKGVVTTRVGYTGGSVQKPTYEQVCKGTTGHAEAVKVEYDPSAVTYATLVKAFFDKHDPTTRDRQGNDVGTQYRSAIYYFDDEQKKTAQAMKEKVAKALGKTVVTEIIAASTFWDAEEYHQRYLEKGGQCAAKGDKTPIRCYG